MYVLPDRKTGFTKSVRELCDEYVHEKNQLKELRLTKVIEWDYATLTRGKKEKNCTNNNLLFIAFIATKTTTLYIES